MTESCPGVTVVVRAHNEEKNIVRCLNSLLIQNYLFDTIIINNGSVDKTQACVEKFLAKNPSFPAGIINESKRGRGIALHRGIDYAKTDIVVCLDADTYTTRPDWLEKLTAPLIKNQKVVASSVRIKFYNGPFHPQLLYAAVRGLTYAISASLDQGWLSLANSALRKSVYYEIGGTEELNGDYPEDRILALKLRFWGKIVYVHDALAYTQNWLLDKKTWGTHLIDELDTIRDLMKVHESQFHRSVRLISLLCAHWDQLKINLTGR